MSLICAVPSFAELSAATGQDVIVVAGLSGTSLRLDKVLPVRRGNSVSFRALLSGGDPATPVRNGTHLSRVGDFLFRLSMVRVVADDGSDSYEAHAQAHIDQLELAAS
jgi:hypothetical protein